MTEKWWNDFYELMFGRSHTDETMKDAADMKYSAMPLKLYKYRTLEDSHLDALERGVLFASSFSKLNDYRESNTVLTDRALGIVCQKVYNKLRLEYGLPEADITSFEDIITQSQRVFKEQATIPYSEKDFTKSPIYTVFTEFVQKTMEEIKENVWNECHKTYNVCCFSAKKDIDPMWGLYADRCKGFCIEYDFKSLGVTHEDVQLMFPVRYKEDNRVFIDDVDSISGNLLMYAFSLKKQDWSFEREWRRFYPFKDDSYPVEMPHPTSIYLGVNAKDSAEMKRLKSYCNNRIPVYQMKYNIFKNILEPNLI